MVELASVVMGTVFLVVGGFSIRGFVRACVSNQRVTLRDQYENVESRRSAKFDDSRTLLLPIHGSHAEQRHH